MPRTKTKRNQWSNWSTRSRFAKPVNMPDVGSMVKAELYEIEMSIPALARKLNVSAERAYRLTRRADWKVSEIMNVSTILSLNIFEWYLQKTQPQETPPAASAPILHTVAELQILRQKTAVLEAENKLLREMIDMLKAK